MIIIVYSETNATNIKDNLGKSEYSYYYVLKEFLPILRSMGIVVSVTHPKQQVDDIYANAQAHGQPCVFFSFTPPHKTCLDLNCPTIPVLAWEFSSIPNEMWEDEPHQNWVYCLQKLGMAITHSGYAKQAILSAMGADFPVVSLPAPVWERSGYAPREASDTKPVIVSFTGMVIDTNTANLEHFTPAIGGNPERDYFRNQNVARHHPVTLTLSGVLYYASFNPTDGRKNWLDMIDGFIVAHRDHADATLILKLVYNGVHEALGGMLRNIQALKPFRCRILILQGYMEDADYVTFQQSMHYVVNTSLGEGQCLPLMEAMSMGKPALAPYHSSMLDYINAHNAFIIRSHLEPTHWPQDPRKAIRTLRSRIDASSVIQAFHDSYEVIKNAPQKYTAMAMRAHQDLQQHCSRQLIQQRLVDFLSQQPKFAYMQMLTLLPIDTANPSMPSLSAVQLPKPVVEPASEPTSETPFKKQPEFIDPKMCGLKDAKYAGWFNDSTGELVPDFPIYAQDRVVDVGCGEGASSLFAAKQGAEVSFFDIEADKVALVTQRMKTFTPKPLGKVCSIDTLPLPENFADKVIAREVLEHLEQPLEGLKELVRIGKPGAKYLLTVPEMTAEMIQKSLAPASHFEKPNHIQIFDKPSFRALVESAGLTVHTQYYTGFYWSMMMNFLWLGEDMPEHATTLDSIQPPFPPLLQQWGETWNALLDKPNAPQVKTALDELLPKTQIIIAQKP